MNKRQNKKFKNKKFHKSLVIYKKKRMELKLLHSVRSDLMGIRNYLQSNM